MPFHVQHGFRPDESVVSVFGGCRATAFTLGLRERYWHEHVINLLRGHGPRTVPRRWSWTRLRRGSSSTGAASDTKEKLIEWIHENATLPAGEYWDYQASSRTTSIRRR